MTVEAAEEMWSRTKLSLQSPDGRRRKIRITKGYTVVTEPDDKIEDVLEAESLPKIMDLYPDSKQIRVTKVDPQKVSPIYYIVLVNYEGEVEGQNFASDPVDTPPTIRWRNVITEEEIDTAFDENDLEQIVPIATLNHEPVRGITERVVDWVALIERNYSYGAFDLPSIHNYLRSVNSDSIITNLGTFAPGVARLTRFEPEEVTSETSGGYVKVHAEVTFRYPYNTTAERAWWKRYLHQGYIMRVRPNGAPADGTSDRFVNAKEGNNNRSLKPIYLDEEGFPIPDPTDPLTPPHWREQPTLFPLPYSALGLF